MPDKKPTLVRAAELLDEHADGLRESYTLRPDYRWPDHDDEHKQAHADHDESRELAERLRAIQRGFESSDDYGQTLVGLLNP